MVCISCAYRRRSEGLAPVCVCVVLFCFVALPGLFSGKDFVHWGIFIRNVTLLCGAASGLSFGLSREASAAVFFLTEGICSSCRRMPFSPWIHRAGFLVCLCSSCSSPSPHPHPRAPRDSD